ncbi:MAG: PRC-barrel domain-containing protein [Marivibrio sp.]|uniref:PRC-barrel domain-containing protein n=1 Tax=Marivibrio sp. TaxID=2039719 RepID=UPI0032ECCB50
MRTIARTSSLIAAGAFVFGAAAGLATPTQPAHGAIETTILSDWSYDALYGDWRLTSLMEASVHAETGERVGWVEDVIFDQNGVIDTVVVETKGDMVENGRFFEVEWDTLVFDSQERAVTLPYTVAQVLDLETAPTHAAFDSGQERRGEALLSMVVNLDGREPYGRVDDLLMNVVGKVDAYVVEPDGEEGMGYALPYDPNRIDTSVEHTTLPYTQDKIIELGRFDYGEMDQ